MLVTTIFAASSLFAVSHAHLFLNTPTPMQGNAIKDPLDASGSNFPCHGVSLPTSGGMPMAAGSSQLLKFEDGGGQNGAVHGGGSCQLSITYETDAAKVKDPSNWHVIYSIEGGCPSTTQGNLEAPNAVQCSSDNALNCLHQFNFTIPKGVKSGQATLAWTWFNTIGNREIYMNCVSADFTGGDGSEMSSFPSMFVANLANLGTCGTTEGTYVGFPNPGKYVTTVLPPGAPSSDIYPISTPTNPACLSGSSGGASGGASSGSVAATTSALSSAASSYASSGADSGSSTNAGMPTASIAGGSSHATAPAAGNTGYSAPITLTTMKTVTGLAGGTAASAPAASASGNTDAGVAAPSATSAAATAGAGTASPGTSPGTSSGSCANGGVACASPGSMICIGSSQFGICDTNHCAVPQALASGTSCSAGVIGAAVGRRGETFLRHAKRHILHAWTV